ncbi:hypothetical protein L486_01521 [Kwoniella mangroviensis CBS 10435]|uniref:Uncharacterized protein n=1 Tax=Kwoniella mangroviensis CBS 10435 TaxID=1331196 RepID=A0A1B9J246_9TREE|nr:hypothetical protein L486_01521 [Kwoniella mangroviensis CBS 10435]
MSNQQPNQGNQGQAINDLSSAEAVQLCLNTIQLMHQDIIKKTNILRSAEAARMVGIMHDLQIPIPVDPRNGKDYPDNMPEEYQRLESIANIRSLPDEHLNAWLGFYDKEHTAEMSRGQQEGTLFIALGESGQNMLVPVGGNIRDIN